MRKTVLEASTKKHMPTVYSKSKFTISHLKLALAGEKNLY